MSFQNRGQSRARLSDWLIDEVASWAKRIDLDRLFFRRWRLFVEPLAMALLCMQPPTLLRAENLNGDAIKAGYIFNFTRFVDWPADAFADTKAPIVIGILGEDPVGDLLSAAAAGKTVNGRMVVVKQFKQGQDLRACNILFISASEHRFAPRVREQLKGSSVLTVGDADGALSTSDIISFVMEDNKVRLQINLEGASEARLSISSKIIAVARVVDHRAKGKSL